MESKFEGQYTRQDFLQAQQIHQLPSPIIRNLRLIGIVAVIVTYIAYMFLHSVGDWVEEIGVFLPVLTILYVLGNPFILPYTTASQTLKDPDFQGIISGKINENGVTINTKRSSSELKWDLYSRAILNNDFVMLYQGNWYFLFPKRFFQSEQDWQSFQHLIKEHIPEKQLYRK